LSNQYYIKYQNRFRITVRVPEIFYVLKDHECCEPDRFIDESELIQRHQSDEENNKPVSEKVEFGREQIDAICKTLQSEFTAETKNISSFKS
jgi:hypothetical protein